MHLERQNKQNKSSAKLMPCAADLWTPGCITSVLGSAWRVVSVITPHKRQIWTNSVIWTRTHTNTQGECVRINGLSSTLPFHHYQLSAIHQRRVACSALCRSHHPVAVLQVGAVISARCVPLSALTPYSHQGALKERDPVLSDLLSSSLGCSVTLSMWLKYNSKWTLMRMIWWSDEHLDCSLGSTWGCNLSFFCLQTIDRYFIYSHRNREIVKCKTKITNANVTAWKHMHLRRQLIPNSETHISLLTCRAIYPSR